MSKALQVAQQQRLIVNSSKSIKNPNNSGQTYHGVGEPSVAVSEPTEALISPDLEDSLAGARQARKALIELGRGLKQDWLDADHWRALAAQRQYRLPHWYLPLSAGGIESLLRDLGLDRDFYRGAFGLKTYQQFIVRNPSMPLWAFAGLCLELQSSQFSSESAI
jgi:hypothetical protein